MAATNDDAETDTPDAAAARAGVRDGLHLLERAGGVVRRLGRDDLLDRVDTARDALLAPDRTVVVLGEFKQGKSSVVNALVRTDVCAVDDDVATAVATILHHGSEPGAVVVLDTDESSQRRPLAVEDVSDVVREVRGAPATFGEDAYPKAVEVALPRDLLAAGLRVVDTPGVGGLTSAHGEIALAALARADAALFVTDASQEITATELDFVRRARERCSALAVAFTKTDLYPYWRRVRDLNSRHLADAGLDAPLFAVSSTLRSRAHDTGDDELEAESGFAPLEGWLRDEVVARGDALAQESAAREVLALVADVAGPLGSEREALTDPERVPEVVAAASAARERAAALRSGRARWQTTLDDGIADLAADIEHELEHRLRQVEREASAQIDGEDPADIWDEYDSWLGRIVGEAVADTFVDLAERANRLSVEVADLFAEDESAGIEVESPDVDGVEGVDELAALEVAGNAPAVRRALVALGSSTGGALVASEAAITVADTFGLIGGIAGVTLATPVMAAVGLLVGAKAVHNERRQRLENRRAAAGVATEEYLDGVAFHVTKRLHDRLRHIERSVRDFWSDRADELVRSAQDTAEAARRAASATRSERDARLEEVDAELERMAALRADARRIAGLAGAGTS